MECLPCSFDIYFVLFPSTFREEALFLLLCPAGEEGDFDHGEFIGLFVDAFKQLIVCFVQTMKPVPRLDTKSALKPFVNGINHVSFIFR